MEFTEIFKAYLEVGILAVSAVVLVVIFVMLVKKLMSTTETKDKSTTKQLNVLLETLVTQNNKLMEDITKNNETLVKQVVQGVTNHVPTKEEDEKQTMISDKIDDCLKEILDETNADRVNIVQYHNGGSGVNKQRFLKMSMTNEVVRKDVKPAMPTFRDQFRSTLAYFTRAINEKGTCYIEDIEDVREEDPSMYDYMLDRGLEAKFGIAIEGKEGYIIGFLSLEFMSKEHENVKKIKSSLLKHQNTIETLLKM